VPVYPFLSTFGILYGQRWW